MGFLESIGSFFAGLPHELYVFLISILPIVELRGSIPVGAGLGVPFYLNYPLSILGNMLPVPFILLFIPKILDFLARFKAFRPMVEWLRKKADKHKGKVLRDEGGTAANAEAAVPESAHDSTNAVELTELCEAAKEDLTDEAEVAAQACEAAPESAPSGGVRKMTRGIFIALLLFVAIPAPGTGAWTGSLIASLFNLPRRSSFFAVLLGVLISGVVMCLASYGVVGFLSFLT